MSTPPVYILGGYQTDFARAWSREGKDISDLIEETAAEAFAASQVNPAKVDVAHIGNFVGALFTGQALLGGVLAEAHPALRKLRSRRRRRRRSGCRQRDYRRDF